MTTLGIIIGNRGFFPAHLCETGRKVILKVLEEEGIKAVALDPSVTQYGSVVTYEDSKKWRVVKAHREKIDGIL
jgi:L-fucose isomerase-like protein